ncbi:PRC-barrel domain-containing protein [Acidisoma cellulosilyticum]|uniref:PRC-barrel domain-containing protein n=1 Tax=Acidisoma cellulosilyticum TaxID=2802395 RepID=UPI001D0BB8F0|nr:PRC-barrel domain-containing protein [Acidisoma cellulosilyticum]
MASIQAPHDPSGDKIAASQVSGTAVFDPAGEKLGQVYDIVIDKVSGQTDYAVLSFGGFLGIGDRYHPLPWQQLQYHTRLGGYVVDMNRAQLETAPHYDADDIGRWSGGHSRAVDAYYDGGITPGGGDAGLGSAPIR